MPITENVMISTPAISAQIRCTPVKMTRAYDAIKTRITSSIA